MRNRSSFHSVEIQLFFRTPSVDQIIEVMNIAREFLIKAVTARLLALPSIVHSFWVLSFDFLRKLQLSIIASIAISKIWISTKQHYAALKEKEKRKEKKKKIKSVWAIKWGNLQLEREGERDVCLNFVFNLILKKKVAAEERRTEVDATAQVSQSTQDRRKLSEKYKRNGDKV